MLRELQGQNTQNLARAIRGILQVLTQSHQTRPHKVRTIRHSQAPKFRVTSHISRLPNPHVRNSQHSRHIIQLSSRTHITGHLQRNHHNLLRTLKRRTRYHNHRHAFRRPRRHHLTRGIQNLFNNTVRPQSLPYRNLNRTFNVSNNLHQPRPRSIHSIVDHLKDKNHNRCTRFVQTTHPRKPVTIRPHHSRHHPRINQ